MLKKIKNKFNEMKEQDEVLRSKEYSDEQFKNFTKNHPFITVIWFSIMGSFFQMAGFSGMIILAIIGFALCIIASKTLVDYVLERFYKKENALLRVVLIIMFYLLISSFPFIIL